MATERVSSNEVLLLSRSLDPDASRFAEFGRFVASVLSEVAGPAFVSLA